MVFIVGAGELIKVRYNFITHFGSSGSKPVIVEAEELIKIRYNFQKPLREFWVEATETFTRQRFRDRIRDS